MLRSHALIFVHDVANATSLDDLASQSTRNADSLPKTPHAEPPRGSTERWRDQDFGTCTGTEARGY